MSGVNATCTEVSGVAKCACESGFTSCDSAPGCETALATSAKNCGKCGHACAGALTCSAGTCQQAVTNVQTNGGVSCALLPPAKGATGGVLDCWGSNSNSQISLAGATQKVPTQVGNGGVFRQFSLSVRHICGLLGSGDGVRCWGANDDLQLGEGTPGSDGTVLTQITGTIGVATAGASSCILTSAHEVYCWGLEGQLGGGQTVDTELPQKVPGIENATALFGGPQGYCVLGAADGSASCWGGALLPANPAPLTSANKQPVVNIASVSIGYYDVCVVTKAGTVALVSFASERRSP